MLNEQDREKLNTFAARVADEEHYDDHPIYGPVPKGANLEGREWESVSNIVDDLKPTVFTQMMLLSLKQSLNGLSNGTVSSAEYIENQILENTQFSSFSLLSQGTGTIILLAKSEDDLSVLRIVPHIDSKIKKASPIRRADSLRSGFQGMLQTKCDNIDVEDIVQVETLPFGKVLDLSSDEQKVYRYFLNKICEGTCYNPDDMKEVMILPDSTIMLFDAGECSYTEEFLNLSPADQKRAEWDSQMLVQRRLDSWALPEQLVWTNPDGSLKQDNVYSSLGKHYQGGLDTDEISVDLS